MATKKHNMHKVHAGLSLDTSPFNQPAGSYRFALNAVTENRDGYWGTLSSEEGNTLMSQLPDDHFPIGGVVMVDNEVVIFHTNGGTDHEIGLFNTATGTYTTLIAGECLNFTAGVDAVYRILDGCERIVYFVDGVNPDRVLNIDDVIKNPDDYSTLDCDVLKQKQDFNVACLSDVNVNNTGGSLEHGVYTILFQYEDKFGNTTDFFFDSHQIPIVDGQYNSTYSAITGGDDAFPATNKSIGLQITNVDTRFKYLNLHVGQTINGVTAYYKLDQLAINSDTLTYTVQTVDTNASEAITLDEIVSTKNIYNISKHIDIHDNRLIKAYLKSEEIDYAAFQIATNAAYAEYEVHNHSVPNPSDDAVTMKSSTYYTEWKSYMRDEVYSLAVVWVLKNGAEIVCHLPGRKKDTTASGGSFPGNDPDYHNRPDHSLGANGETGWDSAHVLAEVGNIRLSDFQHLPDSDIVTVGNKGYVELWKAYNTAHRTEVNVNPDTTFSTAGEFAYFESDYFYPTSQDCDGNYIFPIEVDGNGDPIPTPIRHHKMPDTTLETHFITDQVSIGANQDAVNKTVRTLGIRVSNIVPPAAYADQVQGYYIAKEKRTNGNATVLDKGLCYINAYSRVVRFSCVDDDIKEYGYQTGQFNISSFRNGMVGGSGLVGVSNGLFPVFSSIWDIDVEHIGFRDINGDNSANVSTVQGMLLYDDKSQSFHAPKHKFYSETYGGDYLKVEQQLLGFVEEEYKSPGNHTSDRDEFDIRMNSALYGQLYGLPTLTNRTIDNSPVNIGPDEEVEEGRLKRHFINATQQETLVVETSNGLNNDTHDPDGINDGKETRALYVSMKNVNRGIYGQLDATQYFKVSKCMHDVSETQVTVFGGDIFISQFSFFKSLLAHFKSDYNNVYRQVAGDQCNTDVVNDQAYITTLDKCLVTFFVESEVNTELRQIDYGSVATDNTFYPLSSDREEFLKLNDADVNAGNFPDAPDTCTGGFGPWACNTYAKNLYEYNADYSVERVAKPHNSLDIDYDYCGLCQEEFPYRIAYSEQSYLEDRDDKFLTFFANNYRDLPATTGPITDLFVNFDELYAHTSQSLFKVFTRPYQINTDQTTLFVGTGDFFAVPPREFSSTEYNYDGCTNKWATKSTEYGTFFVGDSGKMFLLTDKVQEISAQGLTNYFEENIPLTASNTDDVFFPLGAGYVSTYDPRHKRILVSKTDYNILGEDPITASDLTNPALVENQSWTMSFSLKTNKWISWHSYLPKFYFNDGDHFYSFNDNEAWQHNEYNFQTYYGQPKSDFIIDFVNNYYPQSVKTFNALSYIGAVETYDITNKMWVDQRDITFDDMIVYTNRQSTGKQPITVKNTTPFASVLSTGVLAEKSENVWRINNIRDYVTDRSVNPMTKNWTLTQGDYFIDMVPNTAAIDANKNPFQLEDIRNQYANFRLFFNNDSEDYRMSIELFDTLNNFSIR